MGGKPYRHDQDAETLRVWLRTLKDATGVGTQALLNKCNVMSRVPKGEEGIERAALDRFTKGRPSKRPMALAALWDFLWEHPVYCQYFPNEAPVAMVDFPAALATFFLPQGSVTNRYPVDALRGSLPGEYVMIRRDFDVGAEADDVRTSLVIVRDEDNILIEELQNYQQRHDGREIRDHDIGYLFPYADYVYFLMKGADNPATAVKLGVINFALPDIGHGAVNYFTGYMFVSSRRGIFPLVRVACRRYSPDLHPQKSGVVKLSDIRDTRALNYIKPDYG